MASSKLRRRCHGPYPTTTLETHFANLTDPRDTDIIGQAFGLAKLEWFKTFLELPNGIPSHDTLGRVFARSDPTEFERCFVSWIQAVTAALPGQVIGIDGKKLRYSHDRRLGQNAIHMVSAWATANHVVLGQPKVDEKSDQSTAFPELLKVLEVAGCIVTIDAMGCQKDIAAQIIEQKGDYLLALKGNQGRLAEAVQALFVQILLLAQAVGVLHLGNISLDGSKIHADASKSKAVSYMRLQALETQLREEVHRWLSLGAQVDGELTLPEGLMVEAEVQRRTNRLAQLAEAKAVLEARAAERLAAEKAE